jgi:hypothetical protein
MDMSVHGTHTAGTAVSPDADEETEAERRGLYRPAVGRAPLRSLHWEHKAGAPLWHQRCVPGQQDDISTPEVTSTTLTHRPVPKTQATLPEDRALSGAAWFRTSLLCIPSCVTPSWLTSGHHSRLPQEEEWEEMGSSAPLSAQMHRHKDLGGSKIVRKSSFCHQSALPCLVFELMGLDPSDPPGHRNGSKNQSEGTLDATRSSAFSSQVMDLRPREEQ